MCYTLKSLLFYIVIIFTCRHSIPLIALTLLCKHCMRFARAHTCVAMMVGIPPALTSTPDLLQAQPTTTWWPPTCALRETPTQCGGARKLKTDSTYSCCHGSRPVSMDSQHQRPRWCCETMDTGLCSQQFFCKIHDRGCKSTEGQMGLLVFN